MAFFAQSLRERVQYGLGYAQGRTFALPSSASDLYAKLIAKATSWISLPLPLISFLALPLFGGSTATINLVFFYLTWSALVLSHDQLSLELWGTLIIRVCFFLLPALGSLAFDLAVPKLSKSVKARGEKQLPARHGQQKVAVIAAVAVGNVLLTVALSTILEVLVTGYLHMRSLVKVTTVVPLPWSIAKHLLQGLAIRGALHYIVHRYLLHTYETILKTWHLSWQHSVDTPFSLVAAYDHPVNYLLADWIPTVLPAYLFRWHVLTWFLFLAVVSLEELFVFSGYSILPSAIILPGMARRTEAHFDSAKDGQEPGNFGHLGLIDFLLGTTCKNEGTVIDDVQDEAEKRQFQERIETAVQAALANMDKKRSNEEDNNSDGVVGKQSEDRKDDRDEDGAGTSGPIEGTGEGDEADGEANAGGPRRSGRRKGAKG